MDNGGKENGERRKRYIFHFCESFLDLFAGKGSGKVSSETMGDRGRESRLWSSIRATRSELYVTGCRANKRKNEGERGRALLANNPAAGAATRDWKISHEKREKSRRSILNCRRGPFAEGAGITAAIHRRHERIGHNGPLIGQFCRWRS